MATIPIETVQVVTYQHAYVAGRTSLCDRCHDDPTVLDALPSLGPVSYGYHYGACDGCLILMWCGGTPSQRP